MAICPRARAEEISGWKKMTNQVIARCHDAICCVSGGWSVPVRWECNKGDFLLLISPNCIFACYILSYIANLLLKEI